MTPDQGTLPPEVVAQRGYLRLRVTPQAINTAILDHPEFASFKATVTKRFAAWRTAEATQLKAFDKDDRPKILIEALSESLLEAFRKVPLLDAYDVYQHLMDYWETTLQDDAYRIAQEGWREGAQPREILQVKNKENKLVWLEKEDYRRGKRRFKSDLLPPALVIDRYFVDERDAIAALEQDLAAIEELLDEKREEQSDEDGLLAEVVEGEGEKQKITEKAVSARLSAIRGDSDYAEEVAALTEYRALMKRQADTKTKIKVAQETLTAKLSARYTALTEDEVKALVVDDKWLATLGAAVQGELSRVSQTLTGRVRQLAERYAMPLPALNNEVNALAARVSEHLKRMSVS